MIALRSLSEIEEADLSPEVRCAARDAITTLVDAYSEPGRPYDPDHDGFVAMLDGAGDAKMMLEATLEGVTHDRGCDSFVSTILNNNQYGLTLIVPDLPTLDPRLREKLIGHLPNIVAHTDISGFYLG